MDSPEQYTLFTHYLTFSAIILGLGVTKLLQNIGRLIEFGKDIEQYPLIYFWMFIIFIGQMQYWWAEYINRHIVPSNFVSILASILFPLCWFLLIEILVPNQESHFRDLKNYYFKKKKFFFGLAILTALIAIFRGHFFFNQPFPAEPAHWIRIGFIVIFIVLGFESFPIPDGDGNGKKKCWVHWAGAFLTLILFCLFIYLYTFTF